MNSGKVKDNHRHSSHLHHHHHQHQLVAPSIGTSSFSVDCSGNSSSSRSTKQHHQSSVSDHPKQQHHQQPSIIREKGAHQSRKSTKMPNRSVGTEGSLSPVSNAYGASGWCQPVPLRRDSGGSACSDRERRGSGSSGRGSVERRDSEESSYSSSRGRKDSGESSTNAAPAKFMEDRFQRDRRDSGSSERSEEGGRKRKKGILRQLMKWGSPAHHFKGKSKKREKEKAEKNETEKDKKEAGDEVDGIQFKMSSEKLALEDREGSLSPLISPCKGSRSRTSTLTDVTDSRSDSEDSHSCSESCSGSCNESSEESEEEKLKQLISTSAGCTARKTSQQHQRVDQLQGRGPPSAYRPLLSSFYNDRTTRRDRSQSVDYVHSQKELRRRRFSENHEWIREDCGKDQLQTGKPLEKVTTQSDWVPKTMYQAILHEMGRRGSLHSHRPADALIDPAHAAILFRDSRGLPVADPFLERILTLSEEDQTEILVKFFKFHKCYDLIPTSAKLVVFDTQLLVKKAFFALVYNGVRAAPLWDSSVRQFVGMLTITDFIRVLHAMYHDSAGRMSELEEHRIETWRRRFLQDKQPLIYIDPDASLFDAICSLVNNRIHRLPIIDQQTGNVLHILTHKRILKFLFLYIHEIPRPVYLNQKLGDVRIGTFENVETAREDTSIIQALTKFLERRVSALPIVDSENRLLDIYARFDVINLAAEKTYNNLDITLKQANEHRNEWFEGVHKCTLEETLFVIMERIVKAEVHRLVVVDEQDKVVGVLSLSDILQHLVMRPEVKDILAPDLKELMKRAESPRPDSTGVSPRSTPVPQSPTSDEGLEESSPKTPQEQAEANEANNNTLSISPTTDLSGGRDNISIIEEEDEKA